jgi:hypothetical protein
MEFPEVAMEHCITDGWRTVETMTKKLTRVCGMEVGFKSKES